MALNAKQEDPSQLELDLDLMRAIQLSLDQQACSSSTPEPNQQSSVQRHSTSSTSSSSSEDVHAQSRGDDEQFSPDDTSLQRALELSYGDLVKGRVVI